MKEEGGGTSKKVLRCGLSTASSVEFVVSNTRYHSVSEDRHNIATTPAKGHLERMLEDEGDLES